MRCSAKGPVFLVRLPLGLGGSKAPSAGRGHCSAPAQLWLPCRQAAAQGQSGVAARAQPRPPPAPSLRLLPATPPETGARAVAAQASRPAPPPLLPSRSLRQHGGQLFSADLTRTLAVRGGLEVSFAEGRAAPWSGGGTLAPPDGGLCWRGQQPHWWESLSRWAAPIWCSGMVQLLAAVCAVLQCWAQRAASSVVHRLPACRLR